MKNSLSLEQHREFGQKVKEFRETLMQSHIMQCYQKGSNASRRVKQAIAAIDRMKDEFDNRACADFPAVPDVTQIYYGMSNKWIESHDGKVKS